MVERWDTFYEVAEYTILTLYLVGLFIVFVMDRKNRKAFFIKLIWTLLGVWIASRVVKTQLVAAYNRQELATGTRNKQLDYWKNQIIFGEAVLISICHWLFATAYLRLALMFPLILRLDKNFIVSKLRKIKTILRVIHAIYDVSVVVLYTLWFVRVDLDSRIYDAETYGKCIAALFLIYSIQSLRRQIKKVNSSLAITARERLMAVHTVIFICQIVCAICERTLNHKSFAAAEEDNLVTLCRMLLSQMVFNGLDLFVTMATICLFILMSVRFSKPLPANLKVIVADGQTDYELPPSTDEERAVRLQQAAEEDARILINILAALIESEERGSFDAENEEEPEFIDGPLTEEEQNALGDSDDETSHSSQALFLSVRKQHAQDHFSPKQSEVVQRSTLMESRYSVATGQLSKSSINSVSRPGTEEDWANSAPLL